MEQEKQCRCEQLQESLDSQPAVFEDILIRLSQCLDDSNSPLEKARNIDRIVFGIHEDADTPSRPVSAGFYEHAKQVILEIRENICKTDSILSKLV